MTSADLSISHNSLRRLFLSRTTGAWNVVSMEEVQYSIMNQQDSTFKIFFFSLCRSPSSRREVTLMRMCLYSVPFCLSGGTWKNVRLRQHVLPGLHYAFSHHCLVVSLRRSRRRYNRGQKAHSERSHFEEWLPVLLCGRVCCPAEREK